MSSILSLECFLNLLDWKIQQCDYINDYSLKDSAGIETIQDSELKLENSSKNFKSGETMFINVFPAIEALIRQVGYHVKLHKSVPSDIS